MTTRKILGRGGTGSAHRIGGPGRLRILLALPAASTVKTATISGVTVLTNASGFTLYSFAPDTSTTSKCNGTCAQSWPPLKGPVTAAGVTGTFSTIARSDGSTQATFDGHP